MSTLRFRYQTLTFGDTDVHLRTLRDSQQFSDPDGVAEKLGISDSLWPLFGVLWPSAHVLAHLMYEFDIEGKRILEVGCGMALASHVLSQRLADISTTDYHPEVGPFLTENIRLNEGRDIPFIRADWAEPEEELGLFDLVIGSDILYEKEHTELLSQFIHNHSHPVSEVVVVDPGRKNQGQFTKKMLALGYTCTVSVPKDTSFLEKEFKGKILHYHRS